MGNVASRWQENQFNGQERFNNEVVPALVDRWHSDSPNAWWRPGSPNAWWENYQPGSSKGGGTPQPIPDWTTQQFNSVPGPPDNQMGTPDVSAFNPVQGPPPSHQVAAPTTVYPTSNVVQQPLQPPPSVEPYQVSRQINQRLPQNSLPQATPLAGLNPYAITTSRGGRGYRNA